MICLGIDIAMQTEWESGNALERFLRMMLKRAVNAMLSGFGERQ